MQSVMDAQSQAMIQRKIQQETQKQMKIMRSKFQVENLSKLNIEKADMGQRFDSQFD